LVLLVHEKKAIWYRWQEGSYQPMPPDAQGILRSQIFPGLWFDPTRFWAGDMASVLAVLRQGIDAPEHVEFLQTLANRSM